MYGMRDTISKMYICTCVLLFPIIYVSWWINFIKTQINLNQLFHYILADAVKRRAVETEMKLLQTLLFATGKFFVKIFVCNYTENYHFSLPQKYISN